MKNLSKEELKKIRELTGNYNDFPPGWKELTEREFAESQCLLNREILCVEFRQMNRPFGSNDCQSRYTSAQLLHQPNGIGFALSSDFFTGKVKFFKFDSFEIIKESFSSLPVVDDSGWDMLGSSRPRYGIKHYGREIRFERELTEEELATVKLFLVRANCPGWTGINIQKRDETTFYFTTTYDSSD